MNLRSVAVPSLGAFIAVLSASAFLAAQSPVAKTEAKAAPKAPAASKPWTQPRTPWGDPDVSGYWSNLTFTPLERPVELGLKEFFTDEEAARVFKQGVTGSFEFTFGHPAEYATYDATIYGQDAWQNGVKPSKRTSVVKDPPNGRLPPLTPAARAEMEREARAEGPSGGTDGPEDLGLGVRCVFLGNGGPPMLPTSGYNANHHIVQGPTSIMIEYEWDSGVQVVHMDGRPPLAADIKRNHGYSRGHWDGNTLVVETTNFRRIGGNPDRLIERFTRLDAETMRYEMTVHDSRRAGPWSGEQSLNNNNGPMFEYACNEGNNGLINILEAARAEDRAAEKAKKSSKQQ